MREANQYRKLMTHKRQNYLECLHKKGAKHANKDIAPDEVIQHIEAGYDAKRDRWNRCDPAERKKLDEEYKAVDKEEINKANSM